MFPTPPHHEGREGPRDLAELDAQETLLPVYDLHEEVEEDDYTFTARYETSPWGLVAFFALGMIGLLGFWIVS